MRCCMVHRKRLALSVRWRNSVVEVGAALSVQSSESTVPLASPNPDRDYSVQEANDCDLTRDKMIVAWERARDWPVTVQSVQRKAKRMAAHWQVSDIPPG
mmetsp:Transcript_14001/g.23194  ORF Transcript_14001/g.23194 Transcript_14001/m.23194 type:complete len:100 (-) Transcript_14001:41-340(-)